MAKPPVPPGFPELPDIGNSLTKLAQSADAAAMGLPRVVDYWTDTLEEMAKKSEKKEEKKLDDFYKKKLEREKKIAQDIKNLDKQIYIKGKLIEERHFLSIFNREKKANELKALNQRMKDEVSALHHKEKLENATISNMAKDFKNIFTKEVKESFIKTGKLNLKQGFKTGMQPQMEMMREKHPLMMGGAGIAVNALGSALSGMASVLGTLKDLFVDVFKTAYNFIENKVLPSVAMTNKMFGAMGATTKQLSSQAIAMGENFQYLGLEFETGRDAVLKFAEGLSTTVLSKQTANLAVKLSEYVGLGAEQSAKLARSWLQSTGNLESLNSVMDRATNVATKYGIPVNQVRKDMGENVNILQRFGTQNVSQFMKAIAVSRQYGKTIKEIDSAFGKNLDTFEATSEVSAKLNTTFGTNINSLKLMMETDPTKRLKMVSDELNRQGKSWDKLNVFEKNVLTTTMKVSEEEASLYFASEKNRKSAQAMLDQRKKQIKADKDWDNAMSSMKQTMLPIAKLFQEFSSSIVNYMAQLGGFTGGAEEMFSKVGSGITNFVKNLSGFFSKQNVDGATSFSKSIGELVKDLSKPEFAESFGKILKTIPDIVMKVGSWFTEKLPGLLKTLEIVIEKISSSSLLKAFGGESKTEKWEEGLKDAETRIAGLRRAREHGWVGSRMTKEEGESKLSAEESRRDFLRRQLKLDDALITKKGEVIKFNQNDNILAFKSGNNSGLKTSQGNAGISSAGGLSDLRIEVIPINLDGRKIGEAVVKISKL